MVMALLASTAAHARMALIVGEPFGSFGTMMPVGHASIYLENACVETPVRLRPCRPGEFGAVISRYHDLRHPGLDWMAFPLPVFLYGTENPTEIPGYMTAQAEADLRERYRQQHLADLVPDRLDRHGHAHPPPYGDWEEGIGSAFDRRLFVYELDTTPEQDTAMLGWLNDRPNHRAYNLGRHNCADFAADLLRLALPPGVIYRNVLGDFDMTTPKQLAREVDTYGHAHPEVHLAVYEVPQLPGSLRRSRTVRGAAESLLFTKRYLAALLVIQPEVVVISLVAYGKAGRWPVATDAQPIAPTAWQPASAASIPSGADAQSDKQANSQPGAN